MNDEKMDELIDEIRKLRIRTQRVNVHLENLAGAAWGLARAYIKMHDIDYRVIENESFDGRDRDDDGS